MSVTPGARKKILEKYGRRCAYCGNILTESTMTIDHFIPKERLKLKHNSKYRGKDNLVPCCKSCNLIKRNKDIRTTRMIFRKLVNGFLKRAGHEELLAREFKFLYEDEKYRDKLPKARKEAMERKKQEKKKAAHNEKIKKSLEDCTNEELLNEICKLKNKVHSLTSKKKRKKRAVPQKQKGQQNKKAAQKKNKKQNAQNKPKKPKTN